jgi:hypothetical protein
MLWVHRQRLPVKNKESFLQKIRNSMLFKKNGKVIPLPPPQGSGPSAMAEWFKRATNWTRRNGGGTAPPPPRGSGPSAMAMRNGGGTAPPPPPPVAPAATPPVAPTGKGVFTRLFGKNKSTYDILSEIAGGGNTNSNKVYKMKQVLRTAKNSKNTLNRLLTNGKINVAQHQELMAEVTTSGPGGSRSVANVARRGLTAISGAFKSTNTLESRIRNALNKSNGQNKTEAIKSILTLNKSTLQNKKNTVLRIHASGNGKMTNTQKNALIKHLNSGAPAPAPAAQSSVKTPIFGGLGGGATNSELNSILKRTNVTNSTKSSLVLDYARRNPERIRRIIDSVSRSTTIGKYDKEYLIEDLLRLQRKEEERRRYRRNKNNNGNRYANSPMSRVSGPFFKNKRNQNVKFNTRIPVTNRGPGTNMGFGNGAQPPPPPSRNNFGGGAPPPRNNAGLGGGGNLFGNGGAPNARLGNGGAPPSRNNFGLGGGTNMGLVKLNNTRTQGLNFGALPSAPATAAATTRRRARPVRMKLLRQTVDNVKKTKLVKQIKKLGKKEGLGLISGRKSKLVKYIVKEIRPPYKKKKSKKSVQAPSPVKENRQLLFKNTLVAGNYGTTNQGLRTGNVPSNQRNNRPQQTFVP